MAWLVSLALRIYLVTHGVPVMGDLDPRALAAILAAGSRSLRLQ